MIEYLQIRRLSVSAITLDFLFRVKVRKTSLNLYIGSNRVIVCSESSIVLSNVYLFVQDSTIFFQWANASLFQYAFVETFTSKFRFIRGDVIAAVCPTTQT